MAENIKKGLLWEKKSYIEMQAFIKRSSSNMEKITPVSEHNKRASADPVIKKKCQCCLLRLSFLGWGALLQQHPQIFACPDMDSHITVRMKIAEEKKMFC